MKKLITIMALTFCVSGFAQQNIQTELRNSVNFIEISRDLDWDKIRSDFTFEEESPHEEAGQNFAYGSVFLTLEPHLGMELEQLSLTLPFDNNINIIMNGRNCSGGMYTDSVTGRIKIGVSLDNYTIVSEKEGKDCAAEVLAQYEIRIGKKLTTYQQVLGADQREPSKEVTGTRNSEALKQKALDAFDKKASSNEVNK